MYYLTAFLGVISLVGIPITLVIFLIQLVRKKKSKKGWGIATIGCLVMFIVCIVIPTNAPVQSNEPIQQSEKDQTLPSIQSAENGETTSESEQPNKSSTDKPSTPSTNGEDKLNGDLADVSDSVSTALIEVGYSSEQGKEIEKILNTIGVSSIQIETMTGEATQGLNAVVAYPNGHIDKNRKFMFTTENGVLFYAGFKGEDLYDSDKGGFLKSYGEVHVPKTDMTENQKQELLDLTESVLDDYFKYIPYYDAWGFARQDDNYMVQCEAYAKNDLNVKDWVRVKVWYEKNDNAYKMTGVEIDGVQYEPK